MSDITDIILCQYNIINYHDEIHTGNNCVKSKKKKTRNIIFETKNMTIVIFFIARKKKKKLDEIDFARNKRDYSIRV